MLVMGSLLAGSWFGIGRSVLLFFDYSNPRFNDVNYVSIVDLMYPFGVALSVAPLLIAFRMVDRERAENPFSEPAAFLYGAFMSAVLVDVGLAAYYPLFYFTRWLEPVMNPEHVFLSYVIPNTAVATALIATLLVLFVFNHQSVAARAKMANPKHVLRDQMIVVALPVASVGLFVSATAVSFAMNAHKVNWVLEADLAFLVIGSFAMAHMRFWGLKQQAAQMLAAQPETFEPLEREEAGDDKPRLFLLGTLIISFLVFLNSLGAFSDALNRLLFSSASNQGANIWTLTTADWWLRAGLIDFAAPIISGAVMYVALVRWLDNKPTPITEAAPQE